MIRGIDTGPSSVVDGVGRVEIYVKANIVGLVTYLMLGVVLISQFGLMGAVFTTIACVMIVHAIIYLSVTRGVLRMSVPWRTFVTPVLAACVPGFLVSLLPRPFPPLVTGVLYGSLYTVMFILGAILCFWRGFFKVTRAHRGCCHQSSVCSLGR
jgi:O-antigen/teichoic acid export membrane protein